LRLDVDRLVVIFRVDYDGQVQPLRVCAGEAGISVAAPLHRSAYAVAVTEKDVVAHSDFISVVQNGSTRHREQECVEQFHFLAVVAAKRSEPATDSKIDAHLALVG